MAGRTRAVNVRPFRASAHPGAAESKEGFDLEPCSRAEVSARPMRATPSRRARQLNAPRAPFPQAFARGRSAKVLSVRSIIAGAGTWAFLPTGIWNSVLPV